jgi:hypothetical protein
MGYQPLLNPHPVSTTDLGAQADAAASSDAGTFSLIALVKRLLGKLPAALGQGTMAQSLSVVLASNQSAVNVSTDNVLDNAVTTASVSSATTLITADMIGYMGGSFHVTSAGTGCTITYEQSNDGTNWSVLPIVTTSTSAGAATASGTTIAGIFSFTSAAAQVRARVSTYGSGTVTVSLVRKRNTPPVSNLSLGASNATIGNLTRRVGYTDSSTPLAGAATFTGTGRSDASGNYSRFNANAYADVAGTLFIDISTDSGATYRAVAEAALEARTVGFAGSLSVALSGAASSTTLYRVRFINGAGAQAAFQLSSSFTAA